MIEKTTRLSKGDRSASPQSESAIGRADALGSPEMSAATMDLHLIRGQAWPRRWQIVKSPVFLLAVPIGILVGIALEHLPSGQMRISYAVSIGITYASIAMGVCISALVLSLGLPGTERLRRWAKQPGSTEGKSALSDLVFALAWAALAQIFLIGACVVATLFGGDLPLAPQSMIPSHFAGLAAGMVIFFYSAFELVVVVQTLVQIGVMIIAEERSENGGHAGHGVASTTREPEAR